MKRRLLTSRPFLVVASGAGMYYFDPELGRGRRARLRDRAVALVRREAREATSKVRYAEGRLEGALAEAQGRGRPHPDDDKEVEQLLRMNLSARRVPTSDIVLEVVDGVVRLRGQVTDEAHKEAVISAAHDTVGVRLVESFLHLPGEPAPNKAVAREVSAAVRR